MYFLLAKGIFILIGLALGVLVYVIVFFRDFVFGNEEDNYIPLENSKKSKQNAKFAEFLARKIRCCQLELSGKETVNDLNTAESFCGFALLEVSEGKKDVNIYNSEGVKLGRITGNSFDLASTIEHWHHGKIFVWGSIGYDTNFGNSYAYAYIPKGYSKEEVTEVEKLYELIQENTRHIALIKERPSDIFSYLDNQQKIENIHLSLGEPEELHIPFRKSIIPSVSKFFEEQQDWEKMIKLESYSSFIDRLSPIYANAIRRRINLAKSMHIDPSSKDKPFNNLQKMHNVQSGPVFEPMEWESPRAYWSNYEKPGYRYSEKKKAWWKQKEGV